MDRILLIEDDENLRRLLRVRLEKLGYIVEETSNGAAGIKSFREHSPAVVITDLLMPGMEGLETIALIRREAPDVRIIAISGGGINAAGSYLRIAKTFGADYTLAKPFSLEEFDLAVNAVLQPPHVPSAAGREFTFLILEDDDDMRYLHQHAIKKVFPGSTIVGCASVDEALHFANRLSMDAVITDHHLGESDGSDFIKRLREQGAACPVLMVTGNSNPEVHRRAYEAGAYRVFHESNADFVECLRSILCAP